MRPWSLLLALAVCCCSGLLLAVRADYYDLAEEDLAYGPSTDTQSGCGCEELRPRSCGVRSA